MVSIQFSLDHTTFAAALNESRIEKISLIQGVMGRSRMLASLLLSYVSKREYL
jgi:hypothetical protein